MIDLQKEIHIGIVKAQKDYIRWANLGLGHSAEYLIVGNIAEKISNLQYTNDINNIFVEYDIEKLAKDDNLQNKTLRKGRCDICIEDDNEYSIIEVKNTLTSATKDSSKFKSIVQDIKRIELFLLNGNYFKECYVCFINANYTKDKENTKENKKLIKKRYLVDYKNLKTTLKYNLKL